MHLDTWQQMVHQNSKDHGFWDAPRTDETVPSKIALMHSELSEALEHYRSGNFELPYPAIYYQASGKPDGFAVELADCVIRILDLAEFLDIDLEEVIKVKHEYNTKRPYKHGGKKV